MPKIIINADDFGMTESCTNAIYEAILKGLATDTTMVANGAYVEPAIEMAQEEHLRNKVGIHFNLTNGSPMTTDILSCSRIVQDGFFLNKGEELKRLRLTSHEKKAIYTELTAQIEFLQGKNIKLTHADSHHHVHNSPDILKIALKVCREHKINKIRILRNVNISNPIKAVAKTCLNLDIKKIHRFAGTDYFGSLDDYQSIHEVHRGIYEIMIHPDYDSAGALIDRTAYINGIPHGKVLAHEMAVISDMEQNSYSDIRV